MSDGMKQCLIERNGDVYCIHVRDHLEQIHIENMQQGVVVNEARAINVLKDQVDRMGYVPVSDMEGLPSQVREAVIAYQVAKNPESV